MPKTETGKKLLALIDDGTDECVWMSKDIDAIEAEAFAAGDRQGWDSGIIAERERIKAAVEGLDPPTFEDNGWYSAVDGILRIIED